MTPNHVRDHEYPGMALKDGDMIQVMDARDPAVNKGRVPTEIAEEDVGPQVECEQIFIQDGETQVFQNPNVMDAWYRDAEQKLAAYRQQTGDLQNTLARERQMIEQARDQNAELVRRNQVLSGQVAILRQGRLPSLVQAFPGYPTAQTYGQQRQAYVPQASLAREAAPSPFEHEQQYAQAQGFQLPPHNYGPFGGYLPGNQQQHGLPPKGLFAPTLPVRRNRPVRDAAFKVAAKTDEEEDVK